MGKKKNKKFKSPAKKTYVAAPIETAKTTENQELSLDSAEESVGSQPIRVETSIDQELNKKYAYVRRDVFKLLTVIGILTILLIGTYYAGQKTALLASLGDWIYKVGNFQLQ